MVGSAFMVSQKVTKSNKKKLKGGKILKKFYMCNEVADRYGVGVRTVWRWVRTGLLRAVQTGRNYYIDPDDLAAFEAARKTRKDTDQTA